MLYLDNIMVFGKTFDEHFKNLEKVIGRLSDAGLKPKKCCFLQKEINFLGHIVSKNGIRTDPSIAKALEQVRTPSCVKALRSFLGITGYYRKFVKDYSKIAKPLYDLTNKEKKWLWTTNFQGAFEKLKSKLIYAPILAYPDIDAGEFILIQTPSHSP